MLSFSCLHPVCGVGGTSPWRSYSAKAIYVHGYFVAWQAMPASISFLGHPKIRENVTLWGQQPYVWSVERWTWLCIFGA